ncbi:MAG: tRNA dihydrouridine synthase DusB [Chitinivibrionales bacterium]|nr:tRNA dihydrouridine synthase DusB [Chitinivibrionales bacterium]
MPDFTSKIILAPMAGISEPVFRRLCKVHGADIVVSEMVSAEGLLQGGAATAALTTFDECERPIGVQLFGADPHRLAQAAAMVGETTRPDFIDLNSGCPVKKVVRRNGGAALLRDRRLFERIVEAMVRASPVPVTVKLRSGWSVGEWVDTEFARVAEQAGAAAVTLHPRSATMMYSGHADWSRIAAVKQAVSIPVVGNGDIREPADAARMFAETGCDAVMIARGSYGNPWLFEQCHVLIDGGEPQLPSARMRLETARTHLDAYLARYGERRTLGEMKKHIAWYLKGIPGASQIRNDVFRASGLDELRGTLESTLSHGESLD